MRGWRGRRRNQIRAADRGGVWLSDLAVGQEAELVDIELPDPDLEALLERGLLPGCRLRSVRRLPFGDPVIHVAGTVLALRKETARRLRVRPLKGGAEAEGEPCPR